MNGKKITCIVCPIGCTINIEENSGRYSISGNKCKRGEKYAVEEMTSPTRIVTSTVKVVGSNHPVVSVKTKEPVPKEKIFGIMDIISNLEVMAPIKVGDVIIKDIAGTGVDLVATRDAAKVEGVYSEYVLLDRITRELI